MASKTKGSKKVGRQKKSGQNLAYKNEGRRDKGQFRRLVKHLKQAKHKNDGIAQGRLRELGKAIGGAYARKVA